MILVFFLVAALIAFSGAALAQNPRNPNPCAGVTGTDTFVNDFASCESYFWCNGEQAFPSGPCTVGLNFADTVCSADVACEVCPPAGLLAVS